MKKAFYGFVEMGVNAVETFIRLHLLVFYSQKVGIPSFWVGVALSISIFWDAAIDPLIGRFSDAWRRRHGTRWHLVIVGAMATAIFLTALYHPPAELTTQHMKWLYLLVMGLLFNTSYALFSIPYTAMVGDFTEDRQERGQLIAWRLVFSNVGAFCGIIVPGYYLSRNYPDAYQQASWVLAMLVLFATFVGSFSLTRDDPDQDIELTDEEFDPPIWEKLKITFHNKPFLSLVGAFFVVNVGLTINSAAALFYYRLRLQFNETQIRNVLVLFLAAFSLSIPLWVWLGKKWGRKYSLIAGALIFGVSSCVIYPLLPVENAVAAYVWASSFGGLVVGAYVLAESILTDVVDYDTIKTREQNFGFYFGLWKFAAKFSRALALLITGLLLDWANVDFPDPDTPNRIALAFGPAVGIFFVLAAVSLIPFGLNEERCAQVKSILRKRSDQISEKPHVT